jgi:hypothetical protein
VKDGRQALHPDVPKSVSGYDFEKLFGEGTAANDED